MTTERISLGAVWQEAAIFMRAEAGLVMPVALACFGLPFVIVQLLIPEPLTPATVVGPWMWALLPYALASLIGTLAISILTLRPATSVQEALRRALRRAPVGILVALIGLAALIAAVVLVTIALAVLAGVTMGPSALGRVQSVSAIAVTIAAITVLVRLLPVWVMVADRDDGAIAAVRAAFGATRRRYLPLLLLRAVAWLSQTAMLLVVWMPFAVILNLLGRAASSVRLGELLALIAGGLVISVILAFWTVYVARLSRGLGSSGWGSNSGI